MYNFSSNIFVKKVGRKVGKHLIPTFSPCFEGKKVGRKVGKRLITTFSPVFFRAKMLKEKLQGHLTAAAI